MELFMHFPKMRVSDVRINLRRVDGSVTKKLLNTADIGTVAEKVGRK